TFSSTSPRFLAASTINSQRSRTFTWPVNSLNIGGRSEISKAASGSGGFICADAFITPGWGLRTIRFDWFWGAHAPPRAGDRALAIANFSDQQSIGAADSTAFRRGRRNVHARRVRSRV